MRLTKCRYNAMSHPMPFMKASNVVAPKKATKEVPDLEDAIEASDDEAAMAEPADDDDETDLKKDKLIKQPKPKAKRAPKKKAGEEDEDGEDGGSKATKGRGKGKAAAKGKAKK